MVKKIFIHQDLNNIYKHLCCNVQVVNINNVLLHLLATNSNEINLPTWEFLFFILIKGGDRESHILYSS